MIGRISLLTAAATLLLSSAASAAPAGKPQRIMSINLCTDQLLLQLVPAERIASVSYLSRSTAHSFLTAEAFGVPINYGTTEEVFRQHPDLVVAGDASTPGVRALLKKTGMTLVELPSADDFEQIRANVRLMARAVGEEEVGESMIAHMDATLAELAATKPEKRVVVAGWDGAGNVPAKGTLFDSILSAAGAENVAAKLTRNIVYGRYTAFDLEQLAAMRPDILAYGNERLARLDLTSEQLKHRMVRKLYAGRQITYPETLYGCGLPQAADAARDLRRGLQILMSTPRPAP